MTTALLPGFLLGLSLIVAIGAQNLFVLRQGIRREHVLAVAVICALSDAALIVVGVSGIGFALQSVPWVIEVVRWAGALFLLSYAFLAARRAWRPSGEALTVAGPANAPDAGQRAPTDAGGRAATDARPRAAATDAAPSPITTAARVRTPLLPVILTCLALTWLNPHVYLDTVFLLGSVAATQGDGRWWFAAGAATASVVWFFGLAYGARHLGRWLATPRAWRILDALIAVVMVAIAVGLLLG
ncbi:LysE/ArgO family amino acid transporter [Microbacterium sp. cx-55]|uniref:LysE/ArgO family amino acid transporter n=1 Tax=Microbacterium sp. cx-55 TaxID=2875948 RepID=UPI001CC1684B|nr:LysE/ArgO family amino acid transporter [Microbacterium sp. cx-55]MBZ4487930.1 LysE/ArgO family amino acid transporter [Microbacterium sp. cx-55]UGB34659.1 LysE/ArgO family amino acid transporter [Microbacterium sp. cx-55]